MIPLTPDQKTLLIFGAAVLAFSVIIRSPLVTLLCVVAGVALFWTSNIWKLP